MKSNKTVVLVYLIIVVTTSNAFLVRVKGWTHLTHEWSARHAADQLPANESWWITENLDSFLNGTELPDAHDKANHHVYFSSPSTVSDDSAARRAKEEYNDALSNFSAGNFSEAALHAGEMTHYISDCASFGHVLDNESQTIHEDYEKWVETRTNNYPNDTFSSYLSYDGNLSTLNAYDATIQVANETAFDDGGSLTAVWMETHYFSRDNTFERRAAESVNLAINKITDVLHTLYASALIQRDIAVTRINPNRTIVSNKTITWINVSVSNQGSVQETFTMVAFYNSTVFASQMITVAANDSFLSTIKWLVLWNTTGVTIGNYNVTVAVAPLPGETDTADNSLSCMIQVSLLGDINGDGRVDMKDVSKVAAAFGATPGNPKWIANGDLDENGVIDMKDVSAIAKHFGEHYP